LQLHLVLIGNRVGFASSEADIGGQIDL